MPIRNKTIIAIWNKGAQGKTTSIRMAATEFSQRSNVSIVTGSIPTTGEISLTLSLNSSLGSITVSFESQGDPNTSLENRLDRIVTNKADIIVCATRTSGGTVEAVDHIAGKHGYQILWMSTLTSGNALHSPLNVLTGEHIIKLIDEVVLGKL